MKARVTMSFESGEAFSGEEIISVVQRIHEGFSKLGQPTPSISTYSDKEGVHRIAGRVETDVEFDS